MTGKLTTTLTPSRTTPSAATPVLRSCVKGRPGPLSARSAFCGAGAPNGLLLRPVTTGPTHLFGPGGGPRLRLREARTTPPMRTRVLARKRSRFTVQRSRTAAPRTVFKIRYRQRPVHAAAPVAAGEGRTSSRLRVASCRLGPGSVRWTTPSMAWHRKLVVVPSGLPCTIYSDRSGHCGNEAVIRTASQVAVYGDPLLGDAGLPRV